jgi:hypothetical protein
VLQRLHRREHLTLDLAPGAELMAGTSLPWGCPRHQPFVLGSLRQHIELPVSGWRGTVRPATPGCWTARSVCWARYMASLFFVTGTPLTRERRLLALRVRASISPPTRWQRQRVPPSPQAQVIVVRVLAPLWSVPWSCCAAQHLAPAFVVEMASSPEFGPCVRRGSWSDRDQLAHAIGFHVA